MMNPFAWLKQAAKTAVIGGIAEALQDVATGMETQPLTLADIQQRLALPAPAVTESFRQSAEIESQTPIATTKPEEKAAPTTKTKRGAK